jgi:hypothetical protein
MPIILGMCRLGKLSIMASGLAAVEDMTDGREGADSF